MTDERREFPAACENSRNEEKANDTATALAGERSLAAEILETERSALDAVVHEMDDNTRFPRTARNFIRHLRESMREQRASSDKNQDLQRRETDAAIREEHSSEDVLQAAAGEKLSIERSDIAQGLAQIELEIEAIVIAAEEIRSASFARADYQQYTDAIVASTRRIHDIAGDLKDPRDDRGIEQDA